MSFTNTDTPSPGQYNVTGDLNVGRGQLGRQIKSAITANAVLWTDIGLGYNTYIIGPSTSGLSVTLPAIGTANNQANFGHQIVIKNTSTTNSFAVNNSGGTLLVTVPATGILEIRADTAAWIILYVDTQNGATDLQSSYNASTTGNPKIALSTTVGTLSISDANNMLSSFNVSDSGGNVLALNHATLGGEPYINLLRSTNNAANSVAINATSNTGTNSFVMNGTNTGANSVVFGGTANNSGTNAMVLASGSFSAPNTVNNRLVTAFTAGTQELYGAVALGTTGSTPQSNRIAFNVSVPTATPVSTTLLTGLVANTVYHGRMVIIGTTAAGIVNQFINEFAFTSTSYLPRVEDVYTTTGANITVSVATTSLSVSINNNNATATRYHVYLTYEGITF